MAPRKAPPVLARRPPRLAPEAPVAPAPDAAFASAFDRALTAWFSRHARDLPWRRDRAAYRVWVSEVMLQQTRVATVVAYFERFLARFPDLAALAAAAESDVLALWSGLGYYRRARGLHRGAREVVERFGGELPRSVEQLRTIRGIGAYTAGAVASLAYGERAPIVDGNVMRVYARVFALDDDIKTSGTQRRLWSVAASMVEHAAAPGPFNEALMELGATVCVPRDPLCLVCPVRPHCRAFAERRQNELPVVGAKKAVPEVHVAALVARRGGEVLLGRRRGDALFGGLWEPPMVDGPDAAAARAALRAIAPGARAVGHVRHVLSHRRLEVSVLTGAPAAGAAFPPLYDAVEYVAEAELGRYGVSTLARKLLAAGAETADGRPGEASAKARASGAERGASLPLTGAEGANVRAPKRAKGGAGVPSHDAKAGAIMVAKVMKGGVAAAANVAGSGAAVATSGETGAAVAAAKVMKGGAAAAAKGAKGAPAAARERAKRGAGVAPQRAQGGAAGARPAGVAATSGGVGGPRGAGAGRKKAAKRPK